MHIRMRTGNEADILHTLCCAAEFANIKVREEGDGGADPGPNLNAYPDLHANPNLDANIKVQEEEMEELEALYDQAPPTD